MCSVECISDLNAEIEHQFNLQRLPTDLMPESLPLQQFHGDEGSPIRLVNFVDRADVGVVQRGCSLGFSLKTAKRLYVVGEFIGQELESNVATELQVFRFIDNTHPARADFAEDTVVGNSLPH